MSPRSGNRRRYDDDPYTFDDPYTQTSPQNLGSPAYEYVGTDEPLTPGRGPTPRGEDDNGRRRRPNAPRRYSRTTSPPRSSRRRPEDSYPSPPPERAARHSSPPRHRDSKRHSTFAQAKRQRYQEMKNNPKLQTYGKKGLNLLSEAAAAYAAAQAAENGEEPPPPPRSRSMGHHEEEDRDRRGSRRHRRYTPSPSPSPSPPRRRHTTRHSDGDRDRARGGDPDRDREQRRRHSSAYHGSPPPLSREPDSFIASERRRGSREHDRDRGYQSDTRDGRDRGRRDRGDRRSSGRYPSSSPSPSPPPRSRSSRSSRRRDRDRDLAKSERSRGGGSESRPRSTGFRGHMRKEMEPPPNADARRWQMAARAALEAGGLTAMRLRKQPGSWSGDKAAKVATAALGAAAIDAFVDHDPRQSRSGGRGVKGIAESALSGFLASQIMGHAGSTKRGKSRY